MEIKDLLSFINIEADNIDDFKAKFQDSFILKKEAADPDKIKSSTTGAITGALTTKMKSLFGLEPEEVKDKKWEDIVELAHQKTTSKIKELEELSIKTNDGVLKELNEKLEKSNRTIAEYKEANQTLQLGLTQKEQEFNSKLKEFKATNILKDSLAKTSGKLSQLTTAENFYFDAKLKENLVIDFDEQDSPIALNKEGKRWQDPNKVGSFLSPEQVVELIASQEGFIKKNNVVQQQRSVQFRTEPSAGNANKDTVKQVHPRAAAAVSGGKA